MASLGMQNPMGGFPRGQGGGSFWDQMQQRMAARSGGGAGGPGAPLQPGSAGGIMGAVGGPQMGHGMSKGGMGGMGAGAMNRPMNAPLGGMGGGMRPPPMGGMGGRFGGSPFDGMGSQQFGRPQGQPGAMGGGMQQMQPHPQIPQGMGSALGGMALSDEATKKNAYLRGLNDRYAAIGGEGDEQPMTPEEREAEKRKQGGFQMFQGGMNMMRGR